MMAKPRNGASPSTTSIAPSPPEKTPIIPLDIRELLGPPPIASLENGEAYERILSSMAEAVAPKDFVEWTWLKDIVDLTWEAGRARRAKAVRLVLARRTAIEQILQADWAPVIGFESFDRSEEIVSFAHRVYRMMGDDDEAPDEDRVEPENLDADDSADYDEPDEEAEDGEEGETFDDMLARLDLTQEAINDAAYLVALKDMETLQRLIDNANARRDAILREIDRRRDALARRLREAVAKSDEIIDAEFENVPGPG
jgi:hypothetical protein